MFRLNEYPKTIQARDNIKSVSTINRDVNFIATVFQDVLSFNFANSYGELVSAYVTTTSTAADSIFLVKVIRDGQEFKVEAVQGGNLLSGKTRLKVDLNFYLKQTDIVVMSLYKATTGLMSYEVYAHYYGVN